MLIAELRQHKAELIALLSKTDGEPQEVRASEIFAEAVLLRDGRRLYRFRASEIPSAVPAHVMALIDQARFRRMVLVADGHDLVVVEPWLSTVETEIIAYLKEQAGAIIATLRGESIHATGGRYRGALPRLR